MSLKIRLVKVILDTGEKDVQAGNRGEVRFTRKEVFTGVNRHKPKGSQKSMEIFHPPLIPPIKGGESSRPLWERVWVRGIFVSILQKWLNENLYFVISTEGEKSINPVIS